MAGDDAGNLEQDILFDVLKLCQIRGQAVCLDDEID
jgi:hypothetical protein